MTPAEARAAAISLFVTQWANRTPIDHDDDNRPTPSAPFVRITMQHNGSFPQSWNGPSVNWTRFGIIHIQIFVPGGQGTAQSDELAQVAVRILEGKTLGSGGVLRLKAAGINDIGRDETNTGLRQTNVTVAFEHEDSHS